MKTIKHYILEDDSKLEDAQHSKALEEAFRRARQQINRYPDANLLDAHFYAIMGFAGHRSFGAGDVAGLARHVMKIVEHARTEPVDPLWSEEYRLSITGVIDALEKAVREFVDWFKP